MLSVLCLGIDFFLISFSHSLFLVLFIKMQSQMKKSSPFDFGFKRNSGLDLIIGSSENILCFVAVVELSEPIAPQAPHNKPLGLQASIY